MSERSVPERGCISRVAERLGFHLVRKSTHDVLPRHFHSPLADPADLPERVWSEPSRLEGIRFDEAAQIAFAESALKPYLAEFASALHPDDRVGDFELDNEYYASGDADVLYAMIRHLRPSRIIEIGSGVSSLVLEHATTRNAAEGAACEIRRFDPYPSPLIQSTAEQSQTDAVSVQEVAPEIFELLDENDVLFVDTSHTVKPGGDVNRIVLDLLPRLRAGVVVHFHDVFLPWNYHRAWIQFGWAEQYLLQAFLALNSEFEILLGVHALARSHGEWLQEAVAGYRPGGQPSAFWIRRQLPHKARPD